jgi:hypothetical protein
VLRTHPSACCPLRRSHPRTVPSAEHVWSSAGASRRKKPTSATVPLCPARSTAGARLPPPWASAYVLTTLVESAAATAPLAGLKQARNTYGGLRVGPVAVEHSTDGVAIPLGAAAAAALRGTAACSPIISSASSPK